MDVYVNYVHHVFLLNIIRSIVFYLSNIISIDWMILNKNNFYKHMFFQFFIILFGNIINGFSVVTLYLYFECFVCFSVLFALYAAFINA